MSNPVANRIIPLVPNAGTYQSQNGEDRWLDAYFGGRRNGFYVEVGAYDGVIYSNSYHFEQIGWSGVLVEPDPVNCGLCKRNRSRARIFDCAAVAPDQVGEIVFHQVAGGEVYSTTNPSGFHQKWITERGLTSREVLVQARTLNSILEEVAPDRVDFVTIDVEGGELDVLRGFDIRRWRPRVVLVETIAKVRAPAIRDYFVANGYAYHRSIDVNDVYLPVTRGKAAVRLIDGLRYLRHRLQHRLARIGELVRRAWCKYGLGRRARPPR